MASASVLMSRLMSMMLMVIVGFAAVRLHVIESRESQTLSRLVIYILQPCLIFRSFQIQITSERMYGFAVSMIFGFVVYIFWIVGTMLVKKPLHLDSIDQCTLIYGNVGNLMLPLVNMMLGSEYVFYASSLQVAFNVFAWTHAQTAISGQRKISVKKMLLNSNMIAMIVGLLFCLLQIPIPEVIDTAMEGLAAMVGPASMLVIGIVIAGSDLRSVFTSRRAYLISFGRLVVMPFAVLVLLKVSGIFTWHPELLPILTVSFILTCAPPAATISQLSVLYNKRPFECSQYNVLSMIACVLTMPLMLALFERVFGL
ncbi:MAG: AEC family transporter [Clostridia bacterium]|nr:AEC family transporter [Clostridia bacterium]